MVGKPGSCAIAAPLVGVPVPTVQTPCVVPEAVLQNSWRFQICRSRRLVGVPVLAAVLVVAPNVTY